jgi:hypothetical protein
MPNKVLILSDNQFENVALHPSSVVANLSADDVAGHEAFHVADNLRDMTSWTPAGTNSARSLYVDVGSGLTVTMNTVILDRGHNLAGQTISVGGYTGPTLATPVTVNSYTIPSSPGGLPTDTNGCLAADGSWVKEFTSITARVFAITTPAMGAGVAPVITGLYAGMSYRFPEYLNSPFADDYDTNVEVQTTKLSRGGLRVLTRKINFRRFALSIDLDVSDYAAFDVQVRPLIRYGQPWWICFDDSDATHSSMIAPFQLASAVRYSPNANPVHREVRGLDLEEVLPHLYT